MHEYQTEKIIEGRCPKCHAPYGVIVETRTNTIVNEYTDCQCSAPEENMEGEVLNGRRNEESICD